MKSKIMVIGIDGASWDLIDPWIEEGSLPTLKKLKNEGVWGYNRSSLPPVTFPNWKCYSTGKYPGKFGVFWFENIDFTNHRIIIPNAYSFKSREVWDYMNDDGLIVAILNMPSTYPPKKVKGFLVAGGPDAKERGYTHPKALQRELEEKFGYKIHPLRVPINKDDINKAAIEEICDLIRMRFKLAKEFAHQVDFLHLTVFYINVLQHFFGSRYPVKEAWKLIDRHLEELIDDADDLFIISDHGTGRINTVFWINTWLEREGYLRTKLTMTNKIFQLLGSNRDRILEISRRMGMERLLRRITPANLRDRIQPGGVHERQTKAQLVDWEKSLAIASGQGPVYLKNIGSSEYEDLRSELIGKLEALTSPITGQKIATKVHRKEELYYGPYLDSAPDLIVEQSDGVHIKGGIGREEMFEAPQKWIAENYRKGIFLFYSSSAKKGVKIENVDIVDIAPTILHLLGISIPDDMDGKVLKDIFDEGSDPAMREVKYRNVDQEHVERDNKIQEEDEIRKRLEELGYLDE